MYKNESVGGKGLDKCDGNIDLSHCCFAVNCSIISFYSHVNPLSGLERPQTYCSSPRIWCWCLSLWTTVYISKSCARLAPKNLAWELEKILILQLCVDVESLHINVLWDRCVYFVVVEGKSGRYKCTLSLNNYSMWTSVLYTDSFSGSKREECQAAILTSC